VGQAFQPAILKVPMMAGWKRLSQNSWTKSDRSTSCPHPVPLPKGEGTTKLLHMGSLSLWERVGVRVSKICPALVVARSQPVCDF